MAIDPSALNDLTIDFSELMSIPIGQRVQAADTNQAFLDSILNSLTPFQVADAFPDYYRKALPDVTNFITSNIDKKLLDAGRNYDQVGGGDQGSAKPYYTKETKLDSGAHPQGTPATPTTDDMKKKLLEKGIDVDGLYSAVGPNGISTDDDKVSYIKALPDDKLSEIGFEKFKANDGKDMIRVKPTEASQLSDKQIIEQAKSNQVGITPENMSKKQSLMYGLQKRGFTKEEAAAVSGNVQGESGFDTSIQDFKKSEHFGLMQWGGNRFKGLQNYAKTKNADWTDPEIQYDWIALERSGESAKYGGSDESRGYKKALASGDVKQMAHDFVQYVERPSKAEIASSAPGRISNAVTAYQEDITTYTKALSDASTPEEINKVRLDMIKTEEGRRIVAATKTLYGTETPSSSQSIADKEGTTTLIPLDKTADADLEDVDPRLVEVVTAGAAHLPAGYKVYISEGYTETGHTSKSQHKQKGKGAIDLHIIGPDGKEIPNKGADDTGMYKLLGQHVYGEMEARHPELKGKLAHGAAFGTVSGGTTPDLMHFDLGGERGVLGPTLSQIGAVEGVKYGPQPVQGAEESTASPTSAEPTNQRTMIISMGTNDWADTSKTYDNTLAAINKAKAKGYKVVVVPPREGEADGKDFTPAHNEVLRAATESGATVEQPQDYSGYGGYHPGDKEYKRIAEKYPGSVAVGDSIANGIGSRIKDGQTVAKDGIGTGDVLSRVDSDQVQSIAPVEPAPPVQAEPTPVPAQTASPIPPEQPPAQTMAQGGFIPEKDNLSVVNENGDEVAKINEGEVENGITKSGTGLRVESNKKRNAEELVTNNEKSAYSADSEQTKQNQSSFQQTPPTPRETNVVMNNDVHWRDNLTSAKYQHSPSHHRAITRSKFGREGTGHFTRATPGSTA